MQLLALTDLIPFHNNPFKPYNHHQLLALMESIKANGVLVPTIVRPHSNEKEKYEILAGHNRVKALKELKRDTVPALIRDDLTETEALLVVTETNLIQRQFDEMLHSERARAITVHYEAMRNTQGYRTDLLEEIYGATYCPVGNKLPTMAKIGGKYSLGTRTIARYLRVDRLIQALKDRLDNSGLALRTAVELSYLRTEEQERVEVALRRGCKVSIKQAEYLRKISEEAELTAEMVAQVLQPASAPSAKEKTAPPEEQSVAIPMNFLAQYLQVEELQEDRLGAVIAEALQLYREKHSLL